jgi:hypothetical protein
MKIKIAIRFVVFWVFIYPILKIKALFWAIKTRWNGSPWKKKRAIKTAVKLHLKTGKRYRVFFVGGKYQAMSRDDIQYQKHYGSFKWHVNSTNMQPFCHWDSNTSNSQLIINN